MQSHAHNEKKTLTNLLFKGPRHDMRLKFDFHFFMYQMVYMLIRNG